MIPEPLIEISKLSVAYRHGDNWERVLHAVSFAIRRGEVFGLVGESGCGKSTVAYQLLGYRPANSRVEGGRIVFKGRDLQSLDRAALRDLRGNRLSLVPQNPTTALSPGMRVSSQIEEVLRFHSLVSETPAIDRRVADLFRMVGLPDPVAIGSCYPHQLSGGQQQRVCIAMALACNPDLIVLDEPTTGLDVTTQHQIVELLAGLRKRLGMSMLYVTHDLGLLAQLADRVGVMYAGHMVEIATCETIFSRPRHPYTRGLIASVPRMDELGDRPDQALRGLLKRDELPTGCPFQPRCDLAESACITDTQHLESVADEHVVACRRWWHPAAPRQRVERDTESGEHRTNELAPLLELENLTLDYAGRRWASRFRPPAPIIVRELSFAIATGSTYALVGESGSGKSTVARAVSGLITLRAGRLAFAGMNLPSGLRARSREIRRRIQYVFQNPDASLNPRARVSASLGRPLELFFHLDRATVAERVAAVLDEVRLDRTYLTRYPDELSGGERQRVAIARALVAEPALLLCDEILSALDVSVQANILTLLQRLRSERRLSMLFISHDLAVVRRLADSVGVLFRGRLMETGTVEEVFSPPFHPYTHELLQASPNPHRAGPPPVRDSVLVPATEGPGCAYAGRCAVQAGAVCRQVPPPMQKVGSHHWIRCHLPPDQLTFHTR